jgi:hypothetical protein
MRPHTVVQRVYASKPATPMLARSPVCVGQWNLLGRLLVTKLAYVDLRVASCKVTVYRSFNKSRRHALCHSWTLLLSVRRVLRQHPFDATVCLHHRVLQLPLGGRRTLSSRQVFEVPLRCSYWSRSSQCSRPCWLVAGVVRATWASLLSP